MTTKSAKEHQSPYTEHSHKEFKEGDKVVYHPVGGSPVTSVGTIKQILTHSEPAGDRHVMAKASEEDPRYVIENLHTGKEAPYKLANIVKKAEGED